MTRLVVHIGAAKTATTYIQAGLFANTDLLAKRGVYLPMSGRLEYNPKSICHHHLAWQFTDAERFRPDIGGLDALAKELQSVEAETVLISSEAFENMASNHALGRVLRARLAAISDDVTVVYVVRDQLSQLNSLYGQKAKMLNTGMKSFEHHTRRSIKTGLFDLDQCFSPWYHNKQTEFVAIPFSELRTEDPLRAVLRAGRIELSDEEELVTGDDTVNASLGPVGVEAAKLLTRYLQGIDPEFTHKSDHARKLYRLASTMARRNGWCDTGFWGWTPEDAARVAEEFAESNQAFAQAVWGTDWPMPLPVDKPQATAELLELSAEDLADVHRYVIAMARNYIQIRTGRPQKMPRKKAQKRANQQGRRNQPGGPKQQGPGNQQARADAAGKQNQQGPANRAGGGGRQGGFSQGGPGQGAPGQGGRGQRGPGQGGEPGQRGPGQGGPGQGGPGQGGPDQRGPGQSGPGQGGPGQQRTADKQPGQRLPPAKVGQSPRANQPAAAANALDADQAVEVAPQAEPTPLTAPDVAEVGQAGAGQSDPRGLDQQIESVHSQAPDQASTATVSAPGGEPIQPEQSAGAELSTEAEHAKAEPAEAEPAVAEPEQAAPEVQPTEPKESVQRSEPADSTPRQESETDDFFDRITW